MDKKLNNLLGFEDFHKSWNPEEQKKTKRTEVGLDIVKEKNDVAIEVSDLKKGIDKKLNNLIDFDDFDKTFNAEKQKKTKRTEVGLDIIKESNGLTHNAAIAKRKSEEEDGELPDGPRYKNRFYVKGSSISKRTGRANKYLVSYDTATNQWCCECRGWIAHRKCHHLSEMGLLGAGPEDKKRLK